MIVHDATNNVDGEYQPDPTCCHYWIIETAQGPISRGECDICHEVRDFKNSVFDRERVSQDSRSTKQAASKENVHQVETDHLTEALDSETAGHATAGEELPIPELEPEESNTEEPEFVGASED